MLCSHCQELGKTEWREEIDRAQAGIEHLTMARPRRSKRTCPLCCLIWQIIVWNRDSERRRRADWLGESGQGGNGAIEAQRKNSWDNLSESGESDGVDDAISIYEPNRYYLVAWSGTLSPILKMSPSSPWLVRLQIFLRGGDVPPNYVPLTLFTMPTGLCWTS